MDPVSDQNSSVGAEIEPSAIRKKQTTTCKPDQTPAWKMILDVIAGICGVALVIITAYYTKAAYRQAVASETAAIAAKGAVKVAADTLAETQESDKQARVDSAANEKRAYTALQATINNFHQEQRAWVGVWTCPHF
ncbi:MAG: hypothetical protein ACLGQX_13475 [Acidobacteriota bacterium]